MKSLRQTLRLAVPGGLCLGMTLLLAGTGCPSPQLMSGGAFHRWGITRPGTTGSEEQLVTAYNLLYDRKFDEARESYQKLVQESPKSTEAHLGLSMALRYSGDLKAALDECGRALELDPDAVAALLNHADLITPYRGLELPDKTDSDRYAEAEKYFRKALKTTHPLADYAYTGLWCIFVATGKYEESRAQLIELGGRNYFPMNLQILAHDLLLGVRPDAILFTNGDNDTYPLYVAQVHQGLQPDVAVINLSLLNLRAVAKLWKGVFNLPMPLSDKEIDALEAKKQGDGVLTPSDQLVADIVNGAHAAGRPVYFSTTVHSERMKPYEDNLVLEGLVYRVAAEKPKANEDIDKIVENVQKVYMPEGPLGEFPWPQNLSPLTRNTSFLGLNYAVLQGRVAEYYSARQERESAAEAYRRMFMLARQAGSENLMGAALDGWSEAWPGNPEVRDLRREFLGS